MEYNVNLTEKFLGDIEEICDYITKILKNEDASNRLREKVMYILLLVLI